MVTSKDTTKILEIGVISIFDIYLFQRACRFKRKLYIYIGHWYVLHPKLHGSSPNFNSINPVLWLYFIWRNIILMVIFISFSYYFISKNCISINVWSKNENCHMLIEWEVNFLLQLCFCFDIKSRNLCLLATNMWFLFIFPLKKLVFFRVMLHILLPIDLKCFLNTVVTPVSTSVNVCLHAVTYTC